MIQEFIGELKGNKSVTLVESYPLSEKLDFLSDIQKIESAKNELQLVETYRFIYKVGKLKVIGYITIPKNLKEKVPCIIHLRGGSRDFAALAPRAIYGQLVKYALEGYIVISTQYPGVEGGDGKDKFGGEDDIASIVKLKDILKSVSVADINKIGIKGHSRGGLMAYMLLREVKWIKSAVIAAAPADQIRQGKERPKWREHQISLWGKSKNELILRSPLRWSNELPKKVPILLMHGTADWRVSPIDSIEMSRDMYTHKIPHRFILFEGADHGITEYKTEYFKQSINWFNRFIKNEDAIPNLKPHGD
ncbi:MAG: prolyl oligopeptidase family serine peptidase [Patescibacteria group bacterium]